MLSSEEVSFVAMRNGFGDFMMILNVTVALVSLIFCGIAGLMILKALAVRHREKRKEEEVVGGIDLDESLPHSRDSTWASQDGPPTGFILGADEDDTDDTATMEQKLKQQRKLSSSPARM